MECPKCKYDFMLFDILVLLEKVIEKEERNEKFAKTKQLPH